MPFNDDITKKILDTFIRGQFFGIPEGKTVKVWKSGSNATSNYDEQWIRNWTPAKEPLVPRQVFLGLFTKNPERDLPDTDGDSQQFHEVASTVVVEGEAEPVKTGYSRVYLIKGGIDENMPEGIDPSGNEAEYIRTPDSIMIGDEETIPNPNNYFANEASGRFIKNSRAIQFDKATVDWGKVYGFGLFTTNSGGTPYYWSKINNWEDEDGTVKDYIEVVKNSIALFDPEALAIGFATEDKGPDNEPQITE